MKAKALLVFVALVVLACGPAETTDSSSEDLGVGVYVSKSKTLASGGYIGDWEHEWGYVLGYMEPGARIYAKVVREDSVYGLITNSHYGAWDHGHHCGWVSLKHLHGSGFHSPVADVCPSPDNDFSLAPHSGGPTGFRGGSWTECNGCVQPAVVLPTCSDFTVYANYDPATHTFWDADGYEMAGRGTIYGNDHYGVPQITANAGYSGFGTRFVTADSDAVEIKDTKRPCTIKGGCTAFGFMHADCIAGAHVGNPAGKGPTTATPAAPSAPCGEVGPGEGMLVGNSYASCSGRYVLTLQTDGNLVWRDQAQNGRAIWATNTSGRDGYAAVFQTDGNLVLYGHYQNALWASHTNGKGGVRLDFQDDGNIVLYDASSNAVWSTGTAGQ
ncbi:MAG TPA: hypothetical protein VGH28_02660 [Polyangiaceae bacterium]